MTVAKGDPAGRPTELELRERLAYLDAEIAAAPGRGAAVGAMDEERRNILRSLLPVHPRVVRDPEKARILAELQTIRAGVDKLCESLNPPVTPPLPGRIEKGGLNPLTSQVALRPPAPPPSRRLTHPPASVEPALPPSVRIAGPRWWEFWRW